MLVIGLKDVVTPLAADRAKELGVRIERSAQASPQLAAGDASLRAEAASGEAAARPSPGAAVPKPPPSTQSGALYRRGASVPPALQPDRPKRVRDAADPRPSPPSSARAMSAR